MDTGGELRFGEKLVVGIIPIARRCQSAVRRLSIR